MAFLSNLLLSINMPSAWPWEWLINDVFSGIASVALRVLLLTVCLKLLLSPLDYYQRYKMRKNQLITQRLKPQLENLEKQYAGNEKVLTQKKNELNRKSGMSMFSTCLPMIVTLVVFIWLWQSLNNIAQYNQFIDYVAMYEVYESVYTDTVGEGDLSSYANDFRVEFSKEFKSEFTAAMGEPRTITDAADMALLAAENAAEAAAAVSENAVAAYDTLYKVIYAENYRKYFVSYYINNSLDYNNADDLKFCADRGDEAGRMNANERVNDYCVIIAQRVTYNYYYGEGDYAEGGDEEDEAYQMQSFLWIKNIWSADVPWTTPIKESKSAFKTAVGTWATDENKSGLEKAVLDEMVEKYDAVTALLRADSRNSTNGFLILPSIALVLNILTQLITRRQQKKSGQTQMTEGQSGCMMNAMIIIMPVMMFYFAVQYTAVFTMYMVANALMSLLINLTTSMIAKKAVRGDGGVSKTDGGAAVIQRYGRPDPKAGSSSGKPESGGAKKPAGKNGKNNNNYKKR